MTEEEKEIIAKYDYEQFLDMEEYKKEHPDDPYCNYYVRGWKDGSYNRRLDYVTSKIEGNKMTSREVKV